MHRATWHFPEAFQKPDRKGGQLATLKLHDQKHQPSLTVGASDPKIFRLTSSPVVFYYRLNTGKEVIENL
jgi:hypothetical protein